MKSIWQRPRHLFYRATSKLGWRRPAFARADGAGQEGERGGYLLVIYPHDYGWVALIPDFRGATGRAVEMESAVLQATQAARRVCSAMTEVGRGVPDPSEISSVKSDPVWVRVYGVDWSRATVRTVSMDELTVPRAGKVMCERSLPRPISLRS
jgi:predicted RNase H-like HicB family nuclease